MNNQVNILGQSPNPVICCIVPLFNVVHGRRWLRQRHEPIASRLPAATIQWQR